MQDYNINVNYTQQQTVTKTSPKYQPFENKTKAASETQKSKSESLNGSNIRKATVIGLAVTHKINSYVGEYTENTISAGRRSVALSYGAFALGATRNPSLAALGAVIYTGDKLIDYGIKVNKENLSADFLRKLSGGTYKTRG
jgi:hypothetical protein